MKKKKNKKKKNIADIREENHFYRDPCLYFPPYGSRYVNAYYDGVPNIYDPLEPEDRIKRETDYSMEKNFRSSCDSSMSDVIGAYSYPGVHTDPFGMYTGRPEACGRRFVRDRQGNIYMSLSENTPYDDFPVQDADDL